MEKLVSEVIDRVKESLPLHKLNQRAQIAKKIDQKIVGEIGISFGAYGELLEQLADEYSISPHAIGNEVLPTERSRFFGLLKSRARTAYQLRVPDLSIEELVKIIREGYWPEEFYEDLGGGSG